MQYRLVKKKTDMCWFYLQGGQICSIFYKSPLFFLIKIHKSLSIIVFKEYCFCWMFLKFILIKFCKIFCCLRLYITPSYWTIDQLVFFPLVRYVASHARAKLDQDIVKFYSIKMIIEQFICSYWKSAWFKKLYHLRIAIGMVDS